MPARKNSSKVKDKNIKKINGKPLIVYSLRSSKQIKEKSSAIICSTDSYRIKKIARTQGIEVPYMRPKKISGKYSRDIEFVNFSLKKFFQDGIIFKYGLILRPTSPIRSNKILNLAYNKLKKNKQASSLRSISVAPVTPYKMWKIKGNFMKPLIKSKLKEQYNMPRQKLPVVYWQNGAFEFFRINYKKKLDSISGKKIIGYKISNKYVSDIDNIDDFKIIDLKMKKIDVNVK